MKKLIIKIVAVFKKHGALKLLKLIFGKLLSPYKAMRFLTELKANNFEATFPNDGGVVINMPKLNFSHTFTRNRDCLSCMAFVNGADKEVALRLIVRELFAGGWISTSKSIVDIGAWISDNAIIWANSLQDSGKVFAIDPSEYNLGFGRLIAKCNQLSNIEFVKAVCSDKQGVRMTFSGSI
jgi:hypothetical protein